MIEKPLRSLQNCVPGWPGGPGFQISIFVILNTESAGV
jgi:hypothetical protein